MKVLFLLQKSLLKTNTKFKRFVCKALNLKGMLTIQIPPAPPIKQKATARWPFALLWFHGGREAPFGVQPELAQQAETTPKGRPLVVKREVSGKAANKSPQLSPHRKEAFCFIVVSRRTRETNKTLLPLPQQPTINIPAFVHLSPGVVFGLFQHTKTYIGVA